MQTSRVIILDNVEYVHGIEFLICIFYKLCLAFWNLTWLMSQHSHSTLGNCLSCLEEETQFLESIRKTRIVKSTGLFFKGRQWLTSVGQKGWYGFCLTTWWSFAIFEIFIYFIPWLQFFLPPILPVSSPVSLPPPFRKGQVSHGYNQIWHIKFQ